jgi:hypothetical protein
MSIIFSAMIGFLHAYIPNFLNKIFNYYQDKTDKIHQLAILDRQIANINMQLKLQVQGQEQIAQTQSDAAIKEKLYETIDTPVGIKLIDSINGLIRPLLSILIMCLYTTLVILIYQDLKELNIDTLSSILVNILYSILNIFTVMTCFYFGSVACNKT